MISLSVFEVIMGNARRTAPFGARRNSSLIRIFHPVATIKCEGAAVYRSQVARDVACLFDVNPSVASWQCMALPLGDDETAHVPDFLISNVDGSAIHIDAPDRLISVGVAVLEMEARKYGTPYRLLSREEIYDGFRLRNAKDLLRYGHHVTPLGDRLRLLAALDDEARCRSWSVSRLSKRPNPLLGSRRLSWAGSSMSISMRDHSDPTRW